MCVEYLRLAKTRKRDEKWPSTGTKIGDSDGMFNRVVILMER